MVASPSAFQTNTFLQSQDLGDRMEQLAEAGDWQRVEAVMRKLNQVLAQIPQSERGEALLATSRSIEKVQSMAEYARRTVVEKLSELQRGRKAQQSYQATGQSTA